MAIRLQSKSIATSISQLIHWCTRYFNRGKLDYPNHDTSKASKKYVKAMKSLSVSPITRLTFLLFYRPILGVLIFITGSHPLKQPFQQTIPRPPSQNLRLRSQQTHYRQTSSPAPMVQGKPDRRRHGSGEDQAKSYRGQAGSQQRECLSVKVLAMHGGNPSGDP